MIVVPFGVVAATRSVLVVVVVVRFGVADDVVDDAFVRLFLGGDVLERLGLLPHLRRDLGTHHMLLPTVASRGSRATVVSNGRHRCPAMFRRLGGTMT